MGWNQCDFPSLHGKLHVGDIIYSINRIKVTSVDSALKLLRSSNEAKIEMVIRRMPLAKVISIRKNLDGEGLGIKRDGGSGEVW